MLTQDELAEVTSLLIWAVSPTMSPRQSLVAGLHPDLIDRLGEGEPRVLVERALHICQDAAWSHKPPAMVQLLTKLLPDIAAVALIVARLREPPPTPPDPFDTLVLFAMHPFLDRHSTRTALKRFLQPQAVQPVVVVNGLPGCGKTYTGDFIDHVLQTFPAVRHCRIELQASQGRSTGLRELASDMVTVMGGDPSTAPLPNTDLDRSAQEHANWIISVANQGGLNWWIMLDGFNADELRPDTQLLITKLSKSLTKGVARNRHRLILADFDRSILPLLPGLVAAETPAPISHASVAAAVAEVVARSPQPLEVKAVTDKVLDGLDDPIVDLTELGLRLTDLIASVSALRAGEDEHGRAARPD